MHVMYPEISPYDQCMLNVNGGHVIYLEQSGNLQGLPVIFLHGGPGSGSNENHRRYFNPEKYRIIIFDQRGCNRSTPRGGIKFNTTHDLIQDMEQIRNYLSIDKWLVFGGSWGATLGLLYAEAYPQHVAGMVLRGAFLARSADLDWFGRSGVNRVFPDYWQEFTGIIPVAEREDLITAYYRRVIEGDRATREKYAKAWSLWSGRVVTYTLQDATEEEDINTIIDRVSIETHYARNRYFISENQILAKIKNIPEVPIIIIHGRRDLTCTLEASWLLHQALPKSGFIIVKDAGHLAGEPPMIDALVSATDRIWSLLT
jgi:proline iminopeptidase